MATRRFRRLGLFCFGIGSYCLTAVAQDARAPLPPAGVAQEQPRQIFAAPSSIAAGGDATFRLSLDDAKSRVLETSVVMGMASQQILAKQQALEAAQKDYLPKLLNSFSYFHFDSDLGTVVTTPGIFNPATAITVPIFRQDSPWYTAAAIQPITPLLKVREAVNISAADVRSAEAQQQLARRELTKGVEQLYFGLLAAQRIRAGLDQVTTGARQAVAANNSPDAQISLVESQQALLSADSQVTTLSEQLNQLVGLPPCTTLQLEEPLMPSSPFTCVDSAVSAAVASSPKIHDAATQVEKAEAAVRLAKADFVPSVNAYGFYVNQSTTPTIQSDFTGVGLTGTYVLEWGKKNSVLREYAATVALARDNLRHQTQELELSTAKAYHEVDRTSQSLSYANQLAQLNREAKLPTDPFQLKLAAKARLESELGAIKADLDYRTAVVELLSITGCSP